MCTLSHRFMQIDDRVRVRERERGSERERKDSESHRHRENMCHVYGIQNLYELLVSLRSSMLCRFKCFGNVEKDNTIMYDTVYVCILYWKQAHDPYGHDEIHRDSSYIEHVNAKPNRDILTKPRNPYAKYSPYYLDICIENIKSSTEQKRQWKYSKKKMHIRTVENPRWQKMENQHWAVNLTPMVRTLCNDCTKQPSIQMLRVMRWNIAYPNQVCTNDCFVHIMF